MWIYDDKVLQFWALFVSLKGVDDILFIYPIPSILRAMT